MLSIQSHVDEIKRGSLWNLRLSPSAYDTAWLALIPDPDDPTRPMFAKCMHWLVQNQSMEGFWAADDDIDTEPVALDCLPATLACLIALKRWGAAPNNINKGLGFFERNVEELLLRKGKLSDVPRWFTVTFLAMLELAIASGLKVAFPDNLIKVLDELFENRNTILLREELSDKTQYAPLLMFLEALPPSYVKLDDLNQYLERNLGNDGSLYQSPSATARAYMATGNTKCLSYLKSLTNTYLDGGVPSLYCMDEELQQLVMVNQLVRPGLTEYFVPEIEQILLQVEQNYKCKRSPPPRNALHNVVAELYKDSLAFWLLRINGHSVSPSMFCWFLHNNEIRHHIEANYMYFDNVLLNVYRATNLMFLGEAEAEEARSFSIKYLNKITQQKVQTPITTNIHISSSLQRMIEYELKLPWTARMDHLEHLMWIEEAASDALWMGKSSHHRLSRLHNLDLQQLKLKNYTLRQSVYRNEHEEVKRWSKERGLCDMGFGREKTTYCYYARAASTSLPCSSSVRHLLAKAAIVVTVADDFFDEKGSMDDLENLTDAVRRWEVEGLSRHSRIIFEALDDVVNEIRLKCFQKHGKDIKDNLHHLWYETFNSWLMEAKWGKGNIKPSLDVYLQNAMISVAVHTMLLPVSCLLSPVFPVHQWSARHHQDDDDMTSLLLFTVRLLNDTQSYLKEEEGKINYVWLYMNEKEKVKLEDSIQHVQSLINLKKQQFVQHVLTNSHLPKPYKQLHLSCLKIFNMFFNSSNLYDSHDDTHLFHDIQKAFIIPPQVHKFKPRYAKNPQQEATTSAAATSSAAPTTSDQYASQGL
uniref:Linalool synthase 2 n=1 Tax=Clarkia breweri TaxID=36903 RepID=Q9ZPN4_CLABR|nr:linalool synthase 2 [Clarkia breweri]